MSASSRLTIAILGAALTLGSAGIAYAMNFTGWGALGPVAAVNTAAHDGCPIESPDGLSLYIASNRDGFTGTTRNLDIWVSTRASTSDPWGTPQNLGAPINSTADDFCPTPVRGNGPGLASARPVRNGRGKLFQSDAIMLFWEKERQGP